jgi:hypothetical protein
MKGEGMKPKGESAYYYGEGPFPHKQNTVYERDRSEDRPVLYDAKGNPLVRARQPLGFQPPKVTR